MKKCLFSSLLCAVLVGTVGCASTSPTSSTNTINTQNVADTINATLPYVKAGSMVACAVAINSTDPTNRTALATQIKVVSAAVATLSVGNAPTTDELKGILSEFAPDQVQWATFASAIQDIYASNYAKLGNDPKLAISILNAISEGCLEASGNYLNSVTLVTTPTK